MRKETYMRKLISAQSPELTQENNAKGKDICVSQNNKACFWELFAGFEGITIAARRHIDCLVLDPLDYHSGQDLLEDDVFSKVCRDCLTKRVHWVHMAPPCRTFTKARRSDKFGTARIIRTERGRDSQLAG
jgi:hypothetical protein